MPQKKTRRGGILWRDEIKERRRPTTRLLDDEELVLSLIIPQNIGILAQ